MHSNDMLLEIVESRPFLVRISAFWRGTLVRFSLAVNFQFVDTFKVPVEIVHGDKALCSRATSLRTFERLVVLEHMLSGLGPLAHKHNCIRAMV
jgi:hypothetical protein